MGCDNGERTLTVSDIISIHAPTWGATAPRDSASARGTISIHAPTWGATKVERKVPYISSISIHAPTWGATKWSRDIITGYEFQSTHPRGVRRVLSYQREALGLFQSTHPRGVRLNLAGDIFRISGISIHAPTWGATHQERTERDI